MRALDDLHTLAQGLRRLTDRDGDLGALLEAVRALPRTEDELSANIAALRDDLKGLQAWLQPLHRELTDLDETAEALERSMSSRQAMLKSFPGYELGGESQAGTCIPPQSPHAPSSRRLCPEVRAPRLR